MSIALVWFRRDLRLADNRALSAACARHQRVVPVYIHAPDEEAPWPPGAASRSWLHRSLAALCADLGECGATLAIRHGPALQALRQLIQESKACAVHWNRLYEPAVIARDRAVKEALLSDGLEAESFNGALLFEPWTLSTAAGGPYRVFTPYWRAAAQPLAQLQVPLPAPKLAKKVPAVAGSPLAELDLAPRHAWDGGFYHADGWNPGERGASARLEQFCDGIAPQYREARDLPGTDGTSRMSPHLHFGEISPRQIVWRLRQLAEEAGSAALETQIEHYLRQLGWREFAHHLLFHFPETSDSPLDRRFAAFAWRTADDSAADLHAWQRGRTGFPIVDAGMRELWHTGWMHNRVRMIAASLLAKNLLIPWQQGARWFWDTLLDANLANNALGWQWTAGCGADAAPYFRVFNPILQSAKFDPQGRYLRRWLPELANLPGQHLAAPWQAPAAVLGQAGITLGRDYPLPIVRLDSSRQRALAAYQRLRSTEHD